MSDEPQTPPPPDPLDGLATPAPASDSGSDSQITQSGVAASHAGSKAARRMPRQKITERRTGPISGRVRPPRSWPVLVAGLVVGALVLIGGIVWGPLGSDRPSPAGTSPVASGVTAVTTTTTPGPRLRTVPQALALLESLGQEGRYAYALQVLAECPPQLRQLAPEKFRVLQDRYSRYVAFEKRLDEALAAGAQSRKLRQLVVDLAGLGIDPELQDLPAARRFLATARRLIGSEEYERLLLEGIRQPRAEAPATSPSPEAEAPPIERRGTSEARRIRQEEAAAAAKERAARTRRQLASARAARKLELEQEAARALAVEEPVPVPAWRGEPAWQGTLVDYAARSFTLEREDGERRRFNWQDAPPETACAVLARALDTEDPEVLRRLGLRALAGAQLVQAADYFGQARQRDAELPLPDLETLAPLTELFQAAGTAEVDSLDLTYDFSSERQTEDWSAPYSMIRVRDGSLKLRSFGPPAIMIHRAVFAELELELEPVDVSGTLGVGCGGDRELVLRAGAAFLGSLWEDEEPEETASFRLDRPFVVRFRELPGDMAALTLLQGGEEVLSGELNGVRWPIPLSLGLRPDASPRPRLELARLALRGRLGTLWLTRERDQVPFRLERAIEDWQRQQARATGQPRVPPLDPRYVKTSAEDDEVLRGVPVSARARLAEARQAVTPLGAGLPQARRLVREAVDGGRGVFWAAEYLLARLQLAESQHGASLARIRLRLARCVAGVLGFYEAHTALAEVCLIEGDLSGARREVQRALELRSDYTPARLTKAWLEVQAGRLEEAVAEARLARTLDGHPSTAREAGWLIALRDGPNWSREVTRESEHYRLRTDWPEQADALLASLEDVRALAPKALPTLKPRPGAVARRGDVFVFRRAEDFYRFLYRTSGDRNEGVAGLFRPRSGQLLLFRAEAGNGAGDTETVLRHEAVHQWVHSLGLALPYWCNEAVANYLAGLRERDGKLVTVSLQRDYLRALSRRRDEWLPLFDLLTLSPAEFYSGDSYLHYAQAWAFLHFCLEGDEPELRQALFAYLGRYSAGQAGDTTGLLGARLEHAYAETFHGLDMEAIGQRWRKFVQRLAESQGVW